MNKYQIKAEIIIHAPIEKVWSIMTDYEKYNEWNSFIRKIDINSSRIELGTIMKFEVEFPNKKKATSREIVKQFAPPTKINNVINAKWEYDFAGPICKIGMIKATRTQTLTELKDGSVYYYTCEKFSGWGKAFLPLKNIQEGFNNHAKDLKKHSEK